MKRIVFVIVIGMVLFCSCSSSEDDIYLNGNGIYSINDLEGNSVFANVIIKGALIDNSNTDGIVISFSDYGYNEYQAFISLRLPNNNEIEDGVFLLGNYDWRSSTECLYVSIDGITLVSDSFDLYDNGENPSAITITKDGDNYNIQFNVFLRDGRDGTEEYMLIGSYTGKILDER